MSEWPSVALTDVSLFIKRGIAPKYAEDGDAVVLNQRCVRDQHVSLAFARNHDTRLKSLPKDRVLAAGDCLVNSTGQGTLGRSAVLFSVLNQVPMTVDSHVTIVRPNQAMVLPQYLGYCVRQAEQRLVDASTGSGGQTELSRDSIGQLQIPLPPLDEQKRIVAQLSEIQGAAEQLQDMFSRELGEVELLEQAHLDYVLGHRAPPILLRDICEVITDGDHQPPPKSDVGIPFITISCIDKEARTIDLSAGFRVPKSYYESLSPARKPRSGDVLITVTGSFGIPVVVRGKDPFCFQRHIALLRPEVGIPAEWLACVLRSRPVQRQINDAATGTAQRTLSLGSLRNLLIPNVEPAEQLGQVEKMKRFASQTGALRVSLAGRRTNVEELLDSAMTQLLRLDMVPG